MNIAEYLVETRKWVAQFFKDRERRDLAEAALDAFESVKDSQSATPAEIAPIVSAATSRFRPVWDIGMSLLMTLSSNNSSAQNAIREMIHSKKGGIRFQAMAALNSRAPKWLALELISTGLHDTGNRVREKAAEAADRLKLVEALPEMETALAAEGHDGARWALAFHIAMIKDGYMIEQKTDHIDITIRLRNGWSSQIISQADIDQMRIPSIITEMRARDFS